MFYFTDGPLNAGQYILDPNSGLLVLNGPGGGLIR
jgi:hypothetical protein